MIYNHNLNALIKAPYGVVTVVPGYPNPSNSRVVRLLLQRSRFIQIQLEATYCWDYLHSRTNRTRKFWSSIGHGIDQVPLRNWIRHSRIWAAERNLLLALKYLNVSLRCANNSRGNAIINANRVESKMEKLERVTSDLIKKNREPKQQSDEATSKKESVQPELLEANQTNILLKQKLDI